jgi:hypothetical protein
MLECKELERWGNCPRCDRPVRLTDPELEAKRGFCARCDAEFEIAENSVRDAISPFRGSGGAELVLATSQAPTPTIVDRSEGSTARLVLYSSARASFAVVTAGSLITAVLFFLILRWLPVPMELLLSLAAAAIVAAVGSLQHWLEEDLEIVDGSLSYSRYALDGRRSRVSLGKIRSIQTEGGAPRAPNERCLRIELDGQSGLVVGRGLRHGEESMVWVLSWLEARITAAIGGESEPRLALME